MRTVLPHISALAATTITVNYFKVLIRGEFDKPDIKYEFSVPKHIKVLPKVSEFEWETGDYGACSASCAGGMINNVLQSEVQTYSYINQISIHETLYFISVSQRMIEMVSFNPGYC